MKIGIFGQNYLKVLTFNFYLGLFLRTHSENGWCNVNPEIDYNVYTILGANLMNILNFYPFPSLVIVT